MDRPIGQSRTRNERAGPSTGACKSTRATTVPRSRPRYAKTAMPALCGRSSRLRGRSVMSFRAPRRREIPRPSPASPGVEAPHDPAADAEVDDHPDPQPHPHVTNTERSGRQEHKRRVVSGSRARWWNGADMEDTLRTGSDPDPLRAHTKPLRAAASRSHPRLPAQRTGEAGPRDVDEQGAASRVPDDDGGGRRSPQLHAKRARAEPDATAGRGTRDGCRGRYEDQYRERASHLPITVNVSVAV